MYRVTLYGHTDQVAAHRDYATVFPGAGFATGKRNNKPAVFVIGDAAFKGTYGDDVSADEIREKAVVQVCKRDEIADQLPKYANPSEVGKVAVKLACGVKLDIIPSTAEPRAVLFGRNAVSDPTTEYGRLGVAYIEMHHKLAAEGATSYQVSDWIDLAKLALTRSYRLPICVWDALGIVSVSDLENIMVAAVGSDPSFA